MVKGAECVLRSKLEIVRDFVTCERFPSLCSIGVKKSVIVVGLNKNSVHLEDDIKNLSQIFAGDWIEIERRVPVETIVEK